MLAHCFSPTCHYPRAAGPAASCEPATGATLRFLHALWRCHVTDPAASLGLTGPTSLLLAKPLEAGSLLRLLLGVLCRLAAAAAAQQVGGAVGARGLAMSCYVCLAGRALRGAAGWRNGGAATPRPLQAWGVQLHAVLKLGTCGVQACRPTHLATGASPPARFRSSASARLSCQLPKDRYATCGRHDTGSHVIGSRSGGVRQASAWLAAAQGSPHAAATSSGTRDSPGGSVM